MGLISAGDENNRRGDEALAGVDNIQKVVEDVLIYETDFSTHVQRVREVIRRCEAHGITLHERKFLFAKPQVEFCGFQISGSGYSPSDHLVSALANFPVPKTRTDVRAFCGLAQQFEPFTPKLTELLAPVRSLLSPKTSFQWETVHQEAFQATLQELTNPHILATFDAEGSLPLETDAAQSRGLGLALWQQQRDGQWRLLQCSSRCVTATEARYSVTEIELLAVVWVVEKCRLFLIGADFEVIVDHRPLLSILNSKTLDELTSPRIVRLREKLVPYRFSAIWRPGIEHRMTD